MYMDRGLEFERIGKDAAATTTRVLAMGQADLKPLKGTTDTADLSPISGLYLTVIAGASDVAAGLTFDFQHCDTADGTFESLAVFGPTKETPPGGMVLQVPVPQGCKNWVTVVKSDATPLNIFMTYDTPAKTLPTFPK